MQESIDLVRATRGNTIEEIHRGSIVVVEKGRVVFCVGSPLVMTPMRSIAKPFQVLPLLESGGIDRFGLDASDIAVMVSSHNGELTHVRQVRSLLGKGNILEAELKCGVQMPYYLWIAHQIYTESAHGLLPIHNNCSGKHAGMLLHCATRGFDREGYWKAQHPAQELTLRAVADALKVTLDPNLLSHDGCGVPSLTVPILNIALAYEQIGSELNSGSRSALATVAQAMLAHPQYVAGTGRVDTEVMLLGSVIAKSGSSGVFALAVPERSLGIAIKMESGSDDASECAAVAVLEQLGVLSDLDIQRLQHFRRMPRMTWTGVQCGYFEPVFDLASGALYTMS